MRRNWLTTLGYGGAVLVFLIAASYAISYAVGYKIDWQTRSFKKTGFILIETYPRGANIKLAGKQLNKSTPAIIKRLLPGTYQVELTKDSYHPWWGDIKVESGLVTEKRNILLTLQSLSLSVLWEKPVERLIVNGDNTKLAILVNNEIWLWGIQNKKEALILSASLISQQVKDRNLTDISRGILTPVSFAPDNKTLLIQSTGLRNYYWLLVNPDDGKIKLLTSGKNISHWKWLNNTELAFLQNNKLSVVTTITGKIKELATSVVDYSLIDGSLYTVVKTKAGAFMLTKTDRGGFIPLEDIAEVPAATSYYLGKIKNNWLIILTKNNLSTLLLGERLDSKLTWKTLANNVTGKVLWDETYLIYKQGEQLTVAEWERLETPAKVAQSRRGELVHFSFDTILYFENQRLKSIDLTGKNQHDLLSITDVNKFIITEPQMSKIIFIDAKTRQLTEATLREKTTALF